MYKLEINLLRDRYLQQKFQRPSQVKRAAQTWEKRVPLIVGGTVGLFLLALAAGGTWFISWQSGTTQEQIDALDAELNRLKARTQSLAALQAETKQINQETEALVGVFNYIKPWSAILSDIKSRTPPQLQITSIQEQKIEEKPKQQTSQEDKESPSGGQPSQAPAELPPIGLKIQGYARTYQDVNDFLLALQGSKFLIPEATAITGAKLVDLPIKWQGLEGEDASKQLEFPKVIEYTIDTALTQVPASQLLAELKSQGAVGLVTRLKTLQQKGAIQP